MILQYYWSSDRWTSQSEHVNYVVFQLDQNKQSLAPSCGLSESENKVEIATLYPNGKHGTWTIAPEKNCSPRLGLGFGLSLGLDLGLEGNFLRGQLS